MMERSTSFQQMADAGSLWSLGHIVGTELVLQAGETRGVIRHSCRRFRLQQLLQHHVSLCRTPLPLHITHSADILRLRIFLLGCRAAGGQRKFLRCGC